MGFRMTPWFQKYWRERQWLQISLILVAIAVTMNATLTRHLAVGGVFMFIIGMFGFCSFVIAIWTGKVSTSYATYERSADPFNYWLATLASGFGTLMAFGFGAFLVVLDVFWELSKTPSN